ncbi:MAG: M23 family metallopeptidase, partial [Chloroflexota bacterium]|nr:M23 family metallopeptidase [Chloroflexota bacterium]
LVIRVWTSGEATLEGSFDGRLLIFVKGEDYYWALAGICAWAQPGMHLLELEADGAETTRAVQVIAGEFPTEHIRFSPEVGKLLDPKLTKAENERMAEVFAAFSPEKLWKGPFAIPVEGRITSPFGTRRSYEGGPVASYHGGVDYGAPEGTPVYAPEAGRVALAEELKVRGKAMVIDHGLGVMSSYWHLSEIDVRTGEEVEKGDLIGKVGTTGLSTASHLHWEMRVSGIAVDPLQWTHQTFP